MGTMTRQRSTADETANATTEPTEDGPRRYVRNVTDAALIIHPSARPIPDGVEPGALASVDAWALPGVTVEGSGFVHVGIRAAEDELAAAAKRAETDETADAVQNPEE